MTCETINSEQIWQSPDGHRTVFAVTILGDDGKEYRRKTYSKEVATVGWRGVLRVYTNPRGERFVRKVLKEA